jgi:hypothetical protein
MAVRQKRAFAKLASHAGSSQRGFHFARFDDFISHRWKAREHPDNSGLQLALALSEIWSDLNYPFENPHNAFYASRTGIWYDYLCLPQYPRSEPEQKTFSKLLTQIPALVMSCVPILVIDKGKDYASRAWCVLETISAYVSNLPIQGVSLAMQAIRYKEVFCKRKDVWDSSLDVKQGFRAGLSKLQSLLKESNYLPELDNAAQNDLDVSNYIECMNALGNIYVSLGRLIKNNSSINDSSLVDFASNHGLHCSLESDVPVVIRMMCEIANDPLKFREL